MKVVLVDLGHFYIPFNIFYYVTNDLVPDQFRSNLTKRLDKSKLKKS